MATTIEARKISLEDALERLSDTLHDLGKRGEVVGIVTKCPELITWYGKRRQWPRDAHIFHTLNMSIGTAGPKCNGTIRESDLDPSCVCRGYFVPAKAFGLKEGWVALANIGLAPDSNLEAYPFGP